jgi:PAS domain S-box-containing protein
VNIGGYRFCWAGAVEPHGDGLVRPLARAGHDDGYLSTVRITADNNDPSGRGPTGTAIRSGRPAVARFIATDPDFAPWREPALQRGYHSSIVLPLLENGTCTGNLNIYSSEPDAFDANEVQLLTQLVADVAFGLSSLRTRAERQKAEQRFRRLWEFAPDAMLCVDASGVITLVNSQAERLFGPAVELVGTPAAELMPQGFPVALSSEMRAAAPLCSEDRHRAPDGSWHWLNWVAYAVPGEDLIYAAARDMTERRQLEQQLAERAAELERSNVELEQFAYVASHDLQEPLRMVASFTSLLGRRYGDRLDERGWQYVHYAVDGATRMQSLVQALLTYSRVGTRGGQLVESDSGTALQQALANLALAIRDARARITWAPPEFPRVVADPVQLAQLFQNLVANALKFHGDAPPAIHIRVEDDDAFCRFAVSDNGIGIEPQHWSRIFVIFQRLHSRESYSGMGMGLAICKKIVERHGGRIWVESQPGRGSTFYFTLRRAAGHGAQRTCHDLTCIAEAH